MVEPTEEELVRRIEQVLAKTQAEVDNNTQPIRIPPNIPGLDLGTLRRGRAQRLLESMIGKMEHVKNELVLLDKKRKEETSKRKKPLKKRSSSTGSSSTVTGSSSSESGPMDYESIGSSRDSAFADDLEKSKGKRKTKKSNKKKATSTVTRPDDHVEIAAKVPLSTNSRRDTSSGIVQGASVGSNGILPVTTNDKKSASEGLSGPIIEGTGDRNVRYSRGAASASQLPVFRCPKCSMTYPTVSALRRHDLVHERPFKCSTCTYRSAEKLRMLQHCRSLHKNDLYTDVRDKTLNVEEPLVFGDPKTAAKTEGIPPSTSSSRNETSAELAMILFHVDEPGFCGIRLLPAKDSVLQSDQQESSIVNDKAAGSAESPSLVLVDSPLWEYFSTIARTETEDVSSDTTVLPEEDQAAETTEIIDAGVATALRDEGIGLNVWLEMPPLFEMVISDSVGNAEDACIDQSSPPADEIGELKEDGILAPQVLEPDYHVPVIVKNELVPFSHIVHMDESLPVVLIGDDPFWGSPI